VFQDLLSALLIAPEIGFAGFFFYTFEFFAL